MVLAEAPTQWSELGGDGNLHPVHDPARIPPTHLSIEEVRLLQKEVLRLRQKNRQRKQALRDLNAAMERKSYRLTLNNIERNALLDEYEDALGKLRQIKGRGPILKCSCLRSRGEACSHCTPDCGEHDIDYANLQEVKAEVRVVRADRGRSSTTQGRPGLE